MDLILQGMCAVLYGFGEQLLFGFFVTLQVTAIALPIGILIGLLGGSACAYGPTFLRVAVGGYTTLFRGLPELLVVFLVYYGTSYLVISFSPGGGHVDVNALIAGSCALAMTFGAYATEVFRGALLTVPLGQIEAGLATGMTSRVIFFRITLPQVWRLALPGLGNLFLVLLKDTALVSVIGVHDLMYKAHLVRHATRDPLTIYLTAAALYLLLTAVSTVALHALEKRANHGFVRTAA